MNGSTLSLQAQRGVSLSGLIGVLALVTLVAIFAMKVVPTYLEFQSAKEGIAAAKAAGGTPNEMRAAFGRTAQVNDIRSLNSGDLTVQKDGSQAEISFDYDKEIPLFKNVHLVIRYAATTAADGVVPERTVDESEKK